jgi:hypothetical protein
MRLWLNGHPEELARIRALRPSDPLAISHRTGVRRNSPGNARRFDSFWVSENFTVVNVIYLQESLKLSDHAAVVADLEAVPR